MTRPVRSEVKKTPQKIEAIDRLKNDRGHTTDTGFHFLEGPKNASMLGFVANIAT